MIPRPRALRSRDLCRLDVRKAAAGPRSTSAPSPRMRRAGRAAQRDDDTARRARPCACIRRYNPEEPPIPAPPAPCYTCATIAPRLIFSWRSTTLICYVVPPKPPSPPPHQCKYDCLQICTFGRFLTAPGPRSISSMLALFGAAPPQATQTLPRLSLCRHACAKTVCDLRALPSLPLLFRYEYEERGVRHRRRRRRRRRWRRRRRFVVCSRIV